MLLQFEMSDRSELDKERLKRILLSHRIITFNGLTYDLPLIYYALEGATNEQLKRRATASSSAASSIGMSRTCSASASRANSTTSTLSSRSRTPSRR
jgi:hypothetical protein